MSKHLVRRVGPAASLLCALLLVSSPAQAYETLHSPYGAPMRWESKEVVLKMAPSFEALLENSTAKSAALMASDAWRGFNKVPDFHIVSTDDDDFDPDDRVSGIYVVSPWTYGPEFVARTFPRITRRGEIVSADIAINGDIEWALLPEGEQPTPPAHDLASVLAHEFGHVLGLDHSEVEDATMWANTGLRETHKRVLHPDDEEGVMHVYEQELPAATCSVGPRRGPSRDAGLLVCLACFFTLSYARLGRRGRRHEA